MKTRNIIIAVVAGTFLASCSPSPKSDVDTSSQTEVVEEVAETMEPTEDVASVVEVIKLNQIPGEFTNGNITVDAGTYTFEVTNSGVDHKVGLVVAPKKDEITKADHLTGAYVVETVNNGDAQPCQGEVVLEKGEYVYFCPMNPTPQYTITVE